jgi:hypothetical protein
VLVRDHLKKKQNVGMTGALGGLICSSPKAPIMPTNPLHYAVGISGYLYRRSERLRAPLHHRAAVTTQ